MIQIPVNHCLNYCILKTYVKILFGVALILACNICTASTYYLSSVSGDDNRSVTEAQSPNTPWKSISKLNTYMASLKPGDVVLFKRGETFYGTVSINTFGNDGSPITFGAYGTGNNPVITSLVTVNQWQSVGNGVYESTNAAFGASVNVVLINNKSQEMGRFPNSDAKNKGYLTVESHNDKSLTDNNINSGTNWKGADVVIRKMHWVIDRHPISNHSGATISYTDAVGRYFPTDKFGYFIQNDIRTLDKFGEWYYNPATKKISVYFGSTPPASSTVEVSTLDNLIFSDRPDGRNSNFTFENLTLRGANANGISVSYGKNYNLRNCNIEYVGNCALNVYSVSNFTVENCNINGAQNNGIYLNEKCNNAVVRNNTIQNTMEFPGLGQNGDHKGMGMYVGGDNIMVEYNKVINTGYIGIYFAGESITIKNNFVNNFCLLKDDGSGIYTFTGDSNTPYTNRKVTGNIVINGIGAKEGTTSSTPPAKGIYVDDNSAGIDISNNTIAATTDQGIFIHNGRNIVMNANTVFNNGTQVGFAHDDYASPITNVTSNGNILFSKTASQTILKMTNKDANVSGMGRFDNNFYPRPFDASSIINVEVTNPSAYNSKFYDLSLWQANFKQDLATVNSPVKIPTHKVNNLIGANRFTNGKFDGNANGLMFYASSGSATATWDNSNKLGSGGSVKLTSAKPSFMIINIGAVDASKKYILRFSAIGNKEANITAFLRQFNSPHATISPISTIKVQNTANTYECLFSFPTTEANTCITFGSDNDDLTYWLDNIEFYEADVADTKADDYILFEYNASSSAKSISLSGSYVDAKNVPYSGTVSIAPYSSIVLIRTSATAPVNTTPDAPSVAGDDKTNLLSAKHDLFASDIVVSENGGTFQAYTAALNVGNVDRPAGYWKFKIKAAAGRNESAEALSPAFTKEIITPAAPVMVADDAKDIISVSHAVYPNEIVFSVNNQTYQPYIGEISVGNTAVPQGYWKFKIKSATDRNESAVVVSPAFTSTSAIITTPAPPSLKADDNANTLAASHSTFPADIMVSENNGTYQLYTGVINVGNVARPSGYWKFKVRSGEGRPESDIVSSPSFSTAIITTPAPPSLTADDNANTLSASHNTFPADIMVSENDGTYQLYTGVINVGNVARPSGYWKFKVRSGEGRPESDIVSSPSFSTAIITTPAPPSLTADDTANTLSASHNTFPADIMVSENDGTYQLYTGVINVGNVARPSGYWKFKVRSGEGRPESSIVSSPSFSTAIITTNPAPPSLTADDTANTLTASHNTFPADIMVSENNGEYKLYTGTINVGNVSRPAGYWKFKIRAVDGSEESVLALSPAFTRDNAFLVKDIVVYPVPVQTILHVKFPKPVNEGSLEVIAMDGRIVKKGTLNRDNLISDIDVSNLPTGTYILLFKNGNDRFAKTFIKM